MPPRHRDRARAGKAGADRRRSEWRVKRKEAKLSALADSAPLDVGPQIREQVVDGLGRRFAKP